EGIAPSRDPPSGPAARRSRGSDRRPRVPRAGRVRVRADRGPQRRRRLFCLPPPADPSIRGCAVPPALPHPERPLAGAHPAMLHSSVPPSPSGSIDRRGSSPRLKFNPMIPRRRPGVLYPVLASSDVLARWRAVPDGEVPGVGHVDLEPVGEPYVHPTLAGGGTAGGVAAHLAHRFHDAHVPVRARVEGTLARARGARGGDGTLGSACRGYLWSGTSYRHRSAASAIRALGFRRSWNEGGYHCEGHERPKGAEVADGRERATCGGRAHGELLAAGTPVMKSFARTAGSPGFAHER